MKKSVLWAVALAVLILLTACGGMSDLRGVRRAFGAGGIQVSSDPSGAKAYVNEKYVGRTPVRVPADQGQYYVKLRKSGFEEFGEWVAVEGGKTTQLEAKLQAKQ